MKFKDILRWFFPHKPNQFPNFNKELLLTPAPTLPYAKIGLKIVIGPPYPWKQDKDAIENMEEI